VLPAGEVPRASVVPHLQAVRPVIKVMPAFDDSTIAEVAPEEMWKILYDPARFPERWAGIETVDAVRPVTARRNYNAPL
jgi:hypothetical protein